jgi:DNA-binding NtrC family response regulator
MTCTATPTSGLLKPIPDLPPEDVTFRNSPVMGKIRQQLKKAAGANIAALLCGQSYPWPVNIRELKKLIKSCVAFGYQENLGAALRNGYEDFLRPEIPSNGVEGGMKPDHC